MNYIYEGQTLVLPCYVLSTIYYQLLLLEIVVDDEIVDESINEIPYVIMKRVLKFSIGYNYTTTTIKTSLAGLIKNHFIEIK